jgi:hypothetical protein
MQAKMNSPGDERLHVSLIHGTFAPNAPWTKQGSDLRKRLQSAFPDDIVFHDDFIWSGWPTHIARHIAAKRLRAYLIDLVSRYPGKHFVIGHSHGGMVAVYSLRDHQLQTKISGLVTLSTPFLVPRRRDFSVFGKVTGIAACVAPFLLIALITGYWAPLFWVAVTSKWPSTAPYFANYATSLIATLANISIFAALITTYILTNRLAQWLSATLEIPKLDPKRTLIIRGPSDEASALLTLFHAIELLVTVMWGRRGPFDVYLRAKISAYLPWFSDTAPGLVKSITIVLAVGLAAFVALWVWFVATWHPQSNSDALDALSSIWDQLDGWLLVLACCAIALMSPLILFYCAAAMLIVATLLIGLPFVVLMPIAVATCGLLAIVTVPELGPAAARIVVSVETTPPGSFRLVQLLSEGSDSEGFLLHSLSYTSPTAADEIIGWIREVLLFGDSETRGPGSDEQEPRKSGRRS